MWDIVEQYDTGCTPGGGKDSMGVFFDAGLLFESNTDAKTTYRQGDNTFLSASLLNPWRMLGFLLHHKHINKVEILYLKKGLFLSCLNSPTTKVVLYSFYFSNIKTKFRFRLVWYGIFCLCLILQKLNASLQTERNATLL